MMRRAGKVAILMRDDLMEGLLQGLALTLPEGATKLMLHADLVEYLNESLGFESAAKAWALSLRTERRRLQ
jgi:hypothetical protein